MTGLKLPVYFTAGVAQTSAAHSQTEARQTEPWGYLYLYQYATAAQQQVSSCLCFTLWCLRMVSIQQKQGRFDLTEGSSCSSIQQSCVSAGQQHNQKLAAGSSHHKLVSEQRKIGKNLGYQDEQKAGKTDPGEKSSCSRASKPAFQVLY